MATLNFNNVYLAGKYCIASPKESEGKLKEYFSELIPDGLWGEDSFEKAEKKMFKTAIEKCISASGMTPQDIDFMTGGDLLNQIITAGYTARDIGIPFLGLYGACSTMAESIIVGSMLVGGGFAKNVVCATSSHYGSAERQYRYPIELGTPKTPTSQYTVTGAACSLVSADDHLSAGIKITQATIGSTVDFGITDANNMGAAMAPAAAQTLATHFEDTQTTPDAYDAIVTGDLGTFGSDLFYEMMQNSGHNVKSNHYDCGEMIFAGVKDTYCGGSGCACAGTVLNGYFITKMQEGQYKKILFMATGALLSPTALQQGESIPSIAHAITIEKE